MICCPFGFDSIRLRDRKMGCLDEGYDDALGGLDFQVEFEVLNLL
jgi:hypothetical protein